MRGVFSSLASPMLTIPVKRKMKKEGCDLFISFIFYLVFFTKISKISLQEGDYSQDK